MKTAKSGARCFCCTILSCLLLTSQNLWPQVPENLTLRQAIEIGLRNNYSILIAENEAEISENNASLGNAGFLPTLDVTAGANKTVFNTRQEFANGATSERDGANTTSRTAAVVLNWTVFDGLNMFSSLRRLGALKEMSELETRVAVETTVAQIIAAYNNILQQEQLLLALADAIAITKERSAIAEANYRIGSGSRLEWNRAQVDLIADSSAYLRQEVVWSNAKIELNRLLAREGYIEFVATDSIEINPSLSYEVMHDRARRQNNTLRIAQTNIGLARHILSEVRSEWFPEVRLNVGYDFSRTESDAGFFLFNRNERFNYGVNLSWNLFDGFNTRRQQQNAQIAIRNSELAYEDIENIVESDVAKVYKRYQSSLQIVRLEEENVQLARQNVDIALQQYRLGAITAVDLREVQKTFVDSETRFLAAQLEAKVAETELLRLSGQLVN